MREENQSSWEKPLGAELATNKLSTHLWQNQTWATLHWQKMNHVLPVAATLLIDPLCCHATLVREGSGIICLRMLALNQSYRTLRQHVCFITKSQNWRENYSSTLQGKMSAKEVTTPKKQVKPSLENCKVCGITTQINARAVISNLSGKTNLGKNFQVYCKYGIVFRKDSLVLFT